MLGLGSGPENVVCDAL